MISWLRTERFLVIEYSSNRFQRDSGTKWFL